MNKYELTNEKIEKYGVVLYRIRALMDFAQIDAGELGGFVEKEENLSQEGDAWVCGDARVYGNAEVCGNAEVYGDAEVCGDARVYGNARVRGDAEVYGDARVCGNARVRGDAEVCGDAWVQGDADYAIAGGFGSVYRTTTFFRIKGNSIGVSCGCFYGTLDEFRSKVKETHGESKTAKEYLMLADLMEYRFSN